MNILNCILYWFHPQEVLEQYYQTNPLPSTDEIGSLSNNLALDKRVIRIW